MLAASGDVGKLFRRCAQLVEWAVTSAGGPLEMGRLLTLAIGSRNVSFWVGSGRRFSMSKKVGLAMICE